VAAPSIAVRQVTSPVAAFGSREFRIFWLGFIAYSLTSGMQTVALGWLTVQLAVRDGVPERGSLYLGLVGLSAALPGLALGLFGGVIADRRDRRLLLVRTQACYAATGLALGLLTATDRIGLVSLLVIAALMSAASAFWHPARQAIQPRLVGEERVMSAFGLNALALNVGLLLGPLLGGLLIIPFGIAGVLLASGLAYGLVALVYLALAPQPVSAEIRHANVVAALAEGLRYVRDEPSVRWLTLLFAAATFLVRPYTDLLPAVATGLGTDAVGLSRLVAAVGAGSLLAGFVTASAARIPRKGLAVAGGYVACGAALTLLATRAEVGSALITVVALSFFLMLSSGLVGALLQYTTPDHLRGRVVGVQTLLIGGGMPLGTLALGAMGSVAGIGPTLVLGGGLLAVIALGAFLVPALRREI
jgi:MFS family permease